MKRVDDFRLRLGNKEYVPIMIGGMGVDISTSELALEAARLGGIGHISDAMVQDVSDRKFDTSFVKEKTKLYKFNINNMDKAVVQFDLDRLAEATRLHVGATMEAKKGDGLIFVNCMEKLTMNAPKETLRTRLSAALDAGIDGITMSAGLHLGSFELIKDHPRFRDAKLGIIVSSVRALQLFLRKVSRLDRLPDYVIVEGPLAGGHLGFGIGLGRVRPAHHHGRDPCLHARRRTGHSADRGRRRLHRHAMRSASWKKAPAACRWRPASPSPTNAACRTTSSRNTSAPARKTSSSTASRRPAIRCACSRARRRSAPASVPAANPTATCSTRPATAPTSIRTTAKCWPIRTRRTSSVMDKTCLCTHMRNFNCWTCGTTTYRLKDTTHKLADGSYQILSRRARVQGLPVQRRPPDRPAGKGRGLKTAGRSAS